MNPEMTCICRKCRTVVERISVIRLEGAPVPSAGDAGSDLSSLALRSIGGFVRKIVLLRSVGARCSVDGRLGVLVAIASGLLLSQESLDLVQTLSASLFPALVSAPTEIAGARKNSFGVEASILIKRHHMRSVRGAENMSAVAAMMTTQEEAKR